MGGGGAIQAMINSIKANAKPKRKHFKRPKNKAEIDALKKSLKEKSISESELEYIKEQIRDNIRYQRHSQNIKIFLVFIIILIPLSIFSYKYYQGKQAKNKLVNENNEIKHHKFVYEGYQLLKDGKLTAAREKFFEANKINPNDYVLELGLAKVYVKMCIYAQRDCWQANKKIEQLLQKYGQQTEIMKIKEEYDKYTPKNQ